MKRLILAVATMLPALVFAQSKKNLPVFGKIDKSALQITSCDFDPDAEALVLADVGEYYCDIRGAGLHTELNCLMRIKILKPEGIDEANVKLHYKHFRNSEDITNLAAKTYNLDATGNIIETELEKKLIYTKKMNARYSEIAFTMPDVKVGSVIEYKYSIRGADLKNWYMQGSLPVKFSHYTLDFPSNFQVHIQSMVSLPIETKDKSTAIRGIRSYTMENVPALREEAFMTCKDDYLQKIESWIVAVNINGRRIPFMKSWEEITTALIEDEDFGAQLKKELPRTADLDAALSKLTDTVQRMTLIHNYVKKNMTWDGNDNIWALQGVKTAWKERTGTSGEINLILINLLRDAGIRVKPVLVSTKDHGRISMFFSHEGQFNKVLAMVETKDKTYILDGTDKFTPSHLIPQDIMFSTGFVVDVQTKKSSWSDIWDEKQMNKNTVILFAEIDENGEMKGKATIQSVDYARTQRLSYLKSGRDKLVDHYFSAIHPTARIDSLDITNEDVDTLPLMQSFSFKMPIASSGDYSYFSPHMFSAVHENPFIADKRSSDVFFGSNQVHTVIANVRIPDGYEFEELPKNTRLTMEDRSLVVTRMFSKTTNMLSAKITVEYKRPFYAADEYAGIKEFYKNMYNILDEQIVFKKKS